MATKTIARPSTPSGESASRVTVLTAPSRWPLLLLVVAILLSAGSIVGLLRLQPDARVDLLIDPNASAFKDQARFADAFGADPVVVMARPGPGASLITPDHIVGLSHLEGKLHQAAGVKKVYGPGTLVNTLAISTTTVLLNVCAQEGKSAETSARQQAVAAGKSQAQQDQAAQQAFQQAVSACAQRYAKAFPSLGVPAVNNPTFIQGVLLEPDGQKVRPFWTWALPDTQHALITVRLNRDASLQQVRHVIDIVRNASSSSDLPELKDLRFTASGSPALTLSVADSVFNALKLLVPLALVAVGVSRVRVGRKAEAVLREVAERGLHVVHGNAPLFEVIAARHPVGGLAHLLHGRQQQPDEHRDDGDDHEQLDQRERRMPANRSAVHDQSPWIRARRTTPGGR